MIQIRRDLLKISTSGSGSGGGSGSIAWSNLITDIEERLTRLHTNSGAPTTTTTTAKDGSIITTTTISNDSIVDVLPELYDTIKPELYRYVCSVVWYIYMHMYI
mgnify:CR=1 FL=1